MKHIPFILVLATLGLAVVAPADTFTFSYQIVIGDPDSGSGILTATYQASDNDYLVTDITGTSSLFGAITGLLAPNTIDSNDNLLFYPNSPFLDQDGLGFAVAGSGDDGNHDVQIRFLRNSYLPYTETNVGYGEFSISPTAGSPTAPEPAPAALLGAGFVVLATLRNRKRKSKRKPNIEPRTCC